MSHLGYCQCTRYKAAVSLNGREIQLQNNKNIAQALLSDFSFASQRYFAARSGTKLQDDGQDESVIIVGHDPLRHARSSARTMERVDRHRMRHLSLFTQVSLELRRLTLAPHDHRCEHLRKSLSGQSHGLLSILCGCKRNVESIEKR